MKIDVDNAAYHTDGKFVYTIDIQDFYPSCSAEYVKKSLLHDFCMSPDVAYLLTRLLTNEGSLPQGSPASMLVAYWIYQRVFNKISEISNNNGIRFSLFVDDMTFSSAMFISKRFVYTIKKMLSSVGLNLHKDKIKLFNPSDFKIVTGCIITPDGELKAQNRKKHEVHMKWKESKDVSNMEEVQLQSLFGKIQSIRQIEKTIFMNQYLNVLSSLRS